MTTDDTDPALRVRALALRLAALLLWFGGAVSAVLAIGITRLAVVPGVTPTRYVIPGSHGHATLGTTPAVVLGVVSAVSIALGLVAHLLGQKLPMADDELTRKQFPVAAAPHRTRRSRTILVLGISFLLLALCIRWARIEQTPDPGLPSVNTDRP